MGTVTGKPPVQVSELSSMYKWDIIVAFDIGTSYSGMRTVTKKRLQQTRSISMNGK